MNSDQLFDQAPVQPTPQLDAGTTGALHHVELNADNAAHGLGKLALTIVNLLHELLERQAIRRLEDQTLTETQIENLGACLSKQSEAINALCGTFGVKREELTLDLGPLGRIG